jgi:hypothetical protein
VLRQGGLGSFPPGTTLLSYRFAEKLAPLSTVDSLAFAGEATNIAAALAGLKDEIAKKNIQAAVLLSDGNYTDGRNPVYDAEELGIPLYTIGVGDTVDQKDLVVDRLTTNAVVYAGTSVPVEAAFHSSGYDGERVEVTLAEGTTIVDRATVTLRPGVQTYQFRMHWTPSAEGTRKLSAAVSKLPGELTDRNNARSQFVDVLKSKLNVLFVAGAPSPDVSALRRVLLEDGRFNVASYVQRAAGAFYEGPVRQASLDSADCLVLANFPTEATPGPVVQLVAAGVTAGRKPLFFLAGKTVAYAKLAPLEPYLPFSWSFVNSGELLVTPAVPERQAHHSLVNLEGRVTAEGWSQLPPVYKTQTVFRAKPEADVLAVAAIQGVLSGEPLVAVRNIARQKCVALSCYGIWRWQLMGQGNAQTEQLLPLFVTNAVRWLTTKDNEKKVRATPAAESFTTTEAVAFTGQVYNDQYVTVDDAEFTVEFSSGSEKYPLPLNPLGSGVYEGSLDGVPAGEYAYTATATRNGRSLGEDHGRFTVGQMNVEFLQTRLNAQLLRQAAARSGGVYLPLAEASSLGSTLASRGRLEPRELTRTNQIELWNWKASAALIVLLFALEWFLRKRTGMV